MKLLSKQTGKDLGQTTPKPPHPKTIPYIPTKIIVYEVNGKIFKARKGIIDGNRVWVDKKTYYDVKPEHIFITTRRKGLIIRKTYYMLAVMVDPVNKISIPPPGNNVEPWRQDEIETAILVRANTQIQKMLQQEREKLMRLMSRTQIIMVIIFLGALLLVGFMYYYNMNQLTQQINDIISKVFPPPTMPGR